LLPSAATVETSKGHRDIELRKGGRIPMPTRQNENEERSKEQNQNHGESYNHLHEVEIQELLNSPVGSFRPSTWLRVQRYLNYLCEQRHETSRAFAILDRAMLEPDSRIRMSNDMVFLVVDKWLNLFIRQQKQFDHKKQYAQSSHYQTKLSGVRGDNNSGEQYVVPPLSVWRKIDSYERCGILLETFTYYRVIDGTAHAKSKRPNSPHGPLLAESILDRMMEQSKENPLLRPCAYGFTKVLTSWEAAGNYCPIIGKEEGPQKALALLQKLKTLYETNWGHEFLPNKNVYRRVMSIFAHGGDADQVEALLEELYSSYLDHCGEQQQRREQPSTGLLYDDLLLPTTPFFSLVLFAWSKSSDPLAAERAEAILDRMLELEASGEIPNLEVNASCFNIVMICYSRRRTQEAALKVENLYDRLLEYQRGNMNKGIGGNKHPDPKRPIAFTYLALITIWVRFNPAKADRYFWGWKAQYDSGNCAMHVDADLLRTLVAGWYNASTTETESAERIDQLVQFAFQSKTQLDDRSLTVEPSVAVVNMAISAWCRKNTIEGVQRAEELLFQMQTYHEANPRSDMKCTVLSYLPIIQSLATMGRIERAEELLIEYVALFKNKNHAQARTFRRRASSDGGKDDSTNSENDGSEHWNTRIFNTVLKGWLSRASVHPDAAVRAEDLLLSMKSAGSRPNAASFQYVLGAWRKSLNHANANHVYQRHIKRSPQVDRVLALFDQERKNGRLGGNQEMQMTIRQGWSLLAL
jgi:hypothetical protein